MLITVRDARRELVIACRDFLPCDLPNADELLEQCAPFPDRTFEEDQARKVLAAMTQSVQRVLVPGSQEKGRSFVYVMAMAFAARERDKPMHLAGYKPGQLTEQLIRVFWAAYDLLDAENGLEAIGPMSTFTVDVPPAPIPLCSSLRTRLATMEVTDFAAYHLPRG